MRIDIKPLSVNDAWQGRRFKTEAYKKYEKDVLFLLPKLGVLKPPFEISFVFGVNTLNDIDNSLKPILDIMQKKYGFNDRDILKLTVVKQVVKRGFEFIEFEINTFDNQTVKK